MRKPATGVGKAVSVLQEVKFELYTVIAAALNEAEPRRGLNGMISSG
jgi:hypothetical protein